MRGQGVLVVALALLGVGCGSGGQRSSHHPEELLGKPPGGATYKVPGSATVSQLVQTVTRDSKELAARDVAVRLVTKHGLRTGAVVVLDVHGGSRAGVFSGFTKEAEGAGVKATPGTVAGAEVRQAKLNGLVATVAVEHGFALETIAADRATGEMLLRPLVQRAATVLF